MRQTAVEWLYERLERMIPRTPLYNMDKEQYFKEAKEMEKQQQGYSEEELKSAFKIGFNIGYGSPVSELDLKQQHCDKWFEQFKKK